MKSRYLAFVIAVQSALRSEWQRVKKEGDEQTPPPKQQFFVSYNKGFRYPTLEFSPSMIRFLQTPGPAKKIVLGALLLIVCVMMVITLVPGGLF
ncbi:MAG TPA: hypothetical protein VF772_22975, partial [Terriglobales bacterium]